MAFLGQRNAKIAGIMGGLGLILSACGGVQFPSSAPPRDINSPPRVEASQSGNVVTRSQASGSSAAFVNASAVKVGPGDTVYELSRRHRVPVPVIIRANNLEPPYLLHVGQRIELPRGKQHKVVRGDTLYSIAGRFDVGVYELARLNDIDAPYTIKLDEILVIPDDAPAPKPALKPVTETVSVAKKTPQPVPAPRQMQRVSEANAGKIAVVPPKKPPPPVQAPPPRAGKGFIWPLQGRLLSSFGVKEGGLRNDGINILAPRGTPVRAAENGVVAYAGNEIRGFGNLLLIKHSGGYITAYAHNDKLLVKRGQRVTRGQKISTVGSTGSVSRPQLHFEVRKGRRPQDPKKYLRKV